MGKCEFPTKPLEKISIDFLVELPITSKGNIHILVVNDVFSKYIQLYAVKDRLSKTAAKCLADYCLRFGILAKLLSDQNPAIESELFQNLAIELGLKKVHNPNSV